MADARTARPVSGEIMAEPSARPAMLRQIDVVDADYEVVSPARHVREPAPAAPILTAPAGMAMLRPASLVRPPRFSPGGPAFWIGGMALAAGAFWVSGGHALVHRSALLAADPAPSGLRIASITSRIDTGGSRAVLRVDGEAANDGAAGLAVPPLQISVAGSDGRITRYRLGTSGRRLAPGERFAFSSRLDVPKDGVRTVSARFIEQDL